MLDVLDQYWYKWVKNLKYVSRYKHIFYNDPLNVVI